MKIPTYFTTQCFKHHMKKTSTEATACNSTNGDIEQYVIQTQLNQYCNLNYYMNYSV